MNETEEFESYARECLRLAWRTDDAFIRNQLLLLAREWMSFSEDPVAPLLPLQRG